MTDQKPRKHNRVEQKSPLRYAHYKFGGPTPEFNPGKLIDISEGGIQFEGKTSVKIGDFLILDLYLPGFDEIKATFANIIDDPDRLKILVEVRWIKEKSMFGVEFRSIDQNQRVSLLDYLKQLIEEA